jgi:hypothetical protein
LTGTLFLLHMTSSYVNGAPSAYSLFTPLDNYYAFYNHKSRLNEQLSLISNTIARCNDTCGKSDHSIFYGSVKDRDEDEAAAAARYLVIADV